jgi:hypothetical protein
LYLQQNKLASVPPELGQLTSLKYLGLTNNKLTSVPAELGCLSQLQTLYLQQNKLASVPPELGQLTSLKYLDLTNNKLTSVPVEVARLSAVKWSANEFRTWTVDFDCRDKKAIGRLIGPKRAHIRKIQDAHSVRITTVGVLQIICLTEDTDTVRRCLEQMAPTLRKGKLRVVPAESGAYYAALRRDHGRKSDAIASAAPTASPSVTTLHPGTATMKAPLHRYTVTELHALRAGYGATLPRGTNYDLVASLSQYGSVGLWQPLDDAMSFSIRGPNAIALSAGARLAVLFAENIRLVGLEQQIRARLDSADLRIAELRTGTAPRDNATARRGRGRGREEKMKAGEAATKKNKREKKASRSKAGAK